MSVYTRVRQDELAAWLEPLGVGPLQDYRGIAAGIQNSNYFVDTARGRYVLTLFETVAGESLTFYLALQAHLASAGLPCPQPLRDPEGHYWRPLAAKPAALLSCLPGEAIDTPTADHCRQLGTMLARLHQAARDLPGAPEHPCGPDWRQRTGQALLSCLPPAEARLLSDELAAQSRLDSSALPRGIIHADLFRDNVLWDFHGQLAGLLDFYFAGTDALLFDLAVVANDWCADEDHLTALWTGYDAVRAITPAERDAWPLMRRAAALRFWLSRLQDRYHPRQGEVITVKDPEDFRRRLEQLRLAPGTCPR